MAEDLLGIIKDEVNVKDIVVDSEMKEDLELDTNNVIYNWNIEFTIKENK